jgi:hypothetical protein
MHGPGPSRPGGSAHSCPDNCSARIHTDTVAAADPGLTHTVPATESIHGACLPLAQGMGTANEANS